MGRRKKKHIPVQSSESNGDAAVSPDSVDGGESTADLPIDEMEALRRELADVNDQFLRAKAEQQNVMRRATQERTEAVRYANANLIKNLLGIIDDFDRTLEHSEKSDLEAVLAGVQLIYDNFRKVLKDGRVEPIDPLGQDFDPRYHEAVLQQPAPDKEPGSVLQVVQLGYRMDDRVLRPAKVIIAALPEGEERAEGESAAEAGGTDVAEAMREQS